MKAAQYQTKGGELQQVNVAIPQPQKGQLRIKVVACGICHSDAIAKYDAMGGGLPRIPGHEVAGVVDEVGEGVTQFKKGDRVGLGWFGNCCNSCHHCRDDKKVCCQKGVAPTGVVVDGGYAQYCLANEVAVARIPEGLSFEDAGPLMCAGITTFNALRHSNAKAGDVVGVVGIGGLGHLAVQFANKMGFRTVAISRGKDKEQLSKQLGAHHYIDTNTQNVGEELKKLGGAKVVVVTAPSEEVINPLIPGMKVEGQILLVAAVSTPVPINSLAMLMNRISITAWASGDSRDSEDTMNFSVLHNIKPMIEIFPLEKAEEAFTRMITNQARFRVVLKVAQN